MSPRTLRRYKSKLREISKVNSGLWQRVDELNAQIKSLEEKKNELQINLNTYRNIARNIFSVVVGHIQDGKQTNLGWIVRQYEGVFK